MREILRLIKSLITGVLPIVADDEQRYYFGIDQCCERLRNHFSVETEHGFQVIDRLCHVGRPEKNPAQDEDKAGVKVAENAEPGEL